MKQLPFTPRVGMILGTTSASPLAMVIKSRTAGPGKMFSANVASHIVCVARWRDSYRRMLDDIELRRVDIIDSPPVKSGELIGIEATSPCVRFVPLEHYLSRTAAGRHYVFAALPKDLTTAEEEIASDVLIRKIGTPYDFSALFEFLGCMKDNPYLDCCSEVPREELHAIGYEYSPEFNFGVSPWDWQKHFEAANRIVWSRYKKFWG